MRRSWPTRAVFVNVWDWRVTASKDIGYENWRLSLIINHLKRSVCVTVWNSAFCPQIALVSFFIIISEQTAIISLYSITWLVFITESECVYCAVRAAPIMQFGLVLVYMAVQWFRWVAGLSPRRPGFDHVSVHVRFAVHSVALGQVFFPPE